MVYIHFPANFTEEELMLQAKYQKLKKKKKALQALKAPKPEPEKPIILKRPAEARDAREVAKKLIKSGVIPAISKQQKQPEQGFKRPRGLERKLISDKVVSGYQPFSAIQMDDGPDNPENKPPRIKNLYDTFANARDREERGLSEKQQQKSEKPRQGNTIYVSGYKITEEFLKKHFSTIGNIINISMEIEKNRGFITFDKVEAAERAISEHLANNCCDNMENRGVLLVEVIEADSATYPFHSPARQWSSSRSDNTVTIYEFDKELKDGNDQQPDSTSPGRYGATTRDDLSGDSGRLDAWSNMFG